MDDNIVDIADVRAKRDRPDPEHVKTDDFGRPMGRYSIEYQMDGRTWSFDFWAYSMEDAASRAEAIRASAELRGQIMSSTPAW